MNGPRDNGEAGPIPARDLLKSRAPEAPAEEGRGGAAEPGTETPSPGTESRVLRFDLGGVEWLVRPAGAGSYGTGRRGAARLLAVHFFRESEPEVPVREALIAAGLFDSLRPTELRELFERATPIDL